MPTSSISTTGSTGERCATSGPYRSAGPSGAIVFVKEGDVFPPDVDGSATEWTLVTDDVVGL